MQQYLDLLNTIRTRGTLKLGAREGMPSTLSLFGYQFRHHLDKGFPLLTTKKMFFKGIVVELLWFLRGDNNIKYLIDNGVNIWNQDAYNYYVRRCTAAGLAAISFQQFVDYIKHAKSLEDLRYEMLNSSAIEVPLLPQGYMLGDMGHQYGKVWRSWETDQHVVVGHNGVHNQFGRVVIDQINRVVEGLKKDPMSRRHILTSIDPVHDNPLDVALYWCHALVQFNCRQIKYFEGDGVVYGGQGKVYRWVVEPTLLHDDYYWVEVPGVTSLAELEASGEYPKYYLDCQMYQRSADSFLGVPFNIASYALLTHILAEVCNMVPGDFIHSFGDVHIYKDHYEAVMEQLKREPKKLPKLVMNIPWEDESTYNLDIDTVKCIDWSMFKLEGYEPYPSIEANLSTGLKK